MTHTAITPLIGAEFDQFLCAPIGEDRNGTTLSVLSALARLDVDPWQEAAGLARMPRATAVMRLTTLIAALPDESTKNIRAKGIVDDLIALLPNGKGFTVRPTDSVLAVAGPRQTQIRMTLGALFIMILIIFALSARLSSAPEDSAKPPAPPVADAATALPHQHNP
jgi:hypothetical protein